METTCPASARRCNYRNDPRQFFFNATPHQSQAGLIHHPHRECGRLPQPASVHVRSCFAVPCWPPSEKLSGVTLTMPMILRLIHCNAAKMAARHFDGLNRTRISYVRIRNNFTAAICRSRARDALDQREGNASTAPQKTGPALGNQLLGIGPITKPKGAIVGLGHYDWGCGSISPALLPRLAPPARGTEDAGLRLAFFLASSSSRLIVPPSMIFLTSSPVSVSNSSKALATAWRSARCLARIFLAVASPAWIRSRIASSIELGGLVRKILGLRHGMAEEHFLFIAIVAHPAKRFRHAPFGHHGARQLRGHLNVA